MSKVIAAYGGGFKPPTKGHFEVVTKALNDFPEVDEFIIYVGGGERGGINQAQSILIWEIYQTYLPMKVKIEPSKAPIGDIIRLGKNNLQDEVYFVIGAREGFEDDMKDVESRTKNIEEKYPNMKVKVITTPDKGISGTNARKASQVSYDDFIKYIPSELSDSEKEEVYDIVKPSISETNNPEDGKAAPYGSGYNELNEDITKSQLDALEVYADNLFAKLGIDIEFTRHFLDRVNDKRNIKPISIPELMGMFKRLHKKHGKPLSKIDNDFDAVVKDFNNNINIPFAINVTPEDIELVAKTIMRKKDFKTSTPVIPLEENASYSQDIDIKSKIMQLTQHMLDKGMNIEPLPKVEFVDGDSDNAREFLGKTAYYNPENQTITLYTEGRHPKDITRSFSHEMIHHIQNLEGRLGIITTTNTQEDDNLNDIEAEANLKGTMTFRNWTDSLNENTSTQSFPNSAFLFGGFFTGVQGMGIGKAVIQDLFKNNPKIENLLLYTQDDAIGFWKKLGGKVIQQGEDKKGTLRYFVQINKNDVDTNSNMKQLGISYKNLSTKKSKIDKGEYVIKMGRQKIGFFFVRDVGTIEMNPMNIIINNLNESNQKDTITFRNWTDSLNEIGDASSKSFEWKEGSASVYDYEVYFTTDLGTKYEVNIDVNDQEEFDNGKTYKMLDIAFYVESQAANQITNKGELFSVMATILNITKHYLKKLKANGIIYNPSKKSKEGLVDNQRNKLYKAYIQKAFPNAKIREFKYGIIVLLDNKPLNENILPQEKFSQETGKDWARESLRIVDLKNYDLENYVIKTLPLESVKPTQFGEDYINASSEYEAEVYDEYLKGEIEARDVRKEDFYPIVVDKDTMEILDGNHRHAVHTMLSIPKIKTILVSKNLNESNKPYKHKHGFDDKLGKDPFGLNAYALEFARGLEEALTIGDKEASVDELESLLDKWSAYSGQYDLLPDIAKLAKNLGVNNGPSIVYRAVPGLDEYPYTKQEVIDYDKEQEIVATTPTRKQAEYFITDNADWAYILEYKPHIIINFDEFEEKYGWTGNWGEGEILIDVTKSKLVNIEDYTKKQSINEGRYDTISNKLSSIAFEAFKDIHDRGDREGSFEFRVDHPDEEHDIPSKDFFFDFEGYVEFTDDLYFVDGGADVGLDNVGDEIQPILNVSFKIPKNPDWQKVSFDIKDVVRHELEHLTQGGGNLKPGKYIEDDQLVRDLVNAKMLPKSQYFKLEGEVDAMLQGMYFKAKKSRQPFGKIINNYLDIFVDGGEITSEEKEDILKVWRNRGKALSLPLFEQTEEQMDYTIYSDMDGVLTDFDIQFMKASEGIIPSEYKRNFGTNGFWDLIEKGGVGYWAGMPWMSDGRKYWDYIKKYTPLLLSSPSSSESSRLGKRVWVKNNLPGTKLILARSTDKQKYADENSILIDDRPSNIDQWRSQGGIGILHVSAEDTIQQLKKLGL